ncbi:MAG: hypothetical protein ACOYUK_04130 [Patescibacteria group bacterium]
MEQKPIQSHPAPRQIFFWRVVIGVTGTLGVGIIVFIIWMAVVYFQANAWAQVPACDALHSSAETTALVYQSQALVDGIGARGGTEVTVHPRPDCVGKAVIQIYYGTHSQGRSIRELIGDTFNGFPYQMFNM